MSNLLKNGNFEADWGEENSHRCQVTTETGTEIREIGNIFTPPGWLTWFLHMPGTWDQPEIKDSWLEYRRRSGEKAILFFTFYRRHNGGFLQQVDVTPGATLRLTAWAHAWSNHTFDHEDDGHWSEGAGYEQVAWSEGSQPDDTGLPQEDAKPNFTFLVGIDPTGGTDPLGDTVIWGKGFHIYNGYVQPLTVEAVAQSDTVTVFLRSISRWAF